MKGSKIILEISLKISLILTIIVMFTDIIQYITLYNFFFSTWFSIVQILLKTSIILVSAYCFFELRNISFLNKFLFCFFSLYLHIFATSLFTIFLHSYVDTDYKERIAEKIVALVDKKIEEYARKNNFEIENSELDKNYARKNISKRYITSTIIESILKSLPLIGVLSLIMAFLIFEEDH